MAECVTRKKQGIDLVLCLLLLSAGDPYLQLSCSMQWWSHLFVRRIIWPTWLINFWRVLLVFWENRLRKCYRFSWLTHIIYVFLWNPPLAQCIALLGISTNLFNKLQEWLVKPTQMTQDKLEWTTTELVENMVNVAAIEVWINKV